MNAYISQMVSFFPSWYLAAILYTFHTTLLMLGESVQVMKFIAQFPSVLYILKFQFLDIRYNDRRGTPPLWKGVRGKVDGIWLQDSHRHAILNHNTIYQKWFTVSWSQSMKQASHSLTQIYVRISFDTLNIYNKMNHCNEMLSLFSYEPKKTGKLKSMILGLCYLVFTVCHVNKMHILQIFYITQYIKFTYHKTCHYILFHWHTFISDSGFHKPQRKC
jgi:hypothetical protein